MPRRTRARRRAGPSLTFTGRLTVLAVLAACSACDSGLTLFGNGVAGSGASTTRTVVFLSTSPPEALPPEEAAAWAWLQTRSELDAELVPFVDLPQARLPRDAILWWHYAAEEALPSVTVRSETLRAVQRHLRGGGNLLLSLIAATWVVPLELETKPADTVSRRAAFAASGAEVGGFQSRGHPLTARFPGGVLPAANPDYRATAAAAYTGGRWPAEGRVWAVHKTENGIDPTIKIGVEYLDVYGAGARVVTLGAHCYFADRDNRNRAQLEQLVLDALRYLDRQVPPVPPGADFAPMGDEEGGTGIARRHWQPAAADFVQVDVPPTSLPPAPHPRTALSLIERSRSGLEIKRYDATGPFTLTAPRALLRGSQLGRIDELRLHPHALLSELRLGIVRPGRGVTWLDAGAGSREFTARPEGAELYYNDGEVEVHMYLTVDRRYPAMVAVLTVRSPAAIDIVATWRAQAGSKVPGGPDTGGPPTIGWDDGAQAVVWRTPDGFTVKGGFGQPTPLHVLGFAPDVHLRDSGLVLPPEPTAKAPAEDESAAAAVAQVGGDPGALSAAVSPPPDLGRVALQVRVPRDRPALVPLVVAGGWPGEFDLDRVFAELVAAPARPSVDNADHYRDYLDRRTMGLLAPDTPFQDAFRWAKVGIAALRATLPDGGTGLLSGVGPDGDAAEWFAVPGALGGSGALWAAMAADAYGDQALAADTLRLLARFQAVDGRIPDAVTTSGMSVENGAAATALYLVALDNHLRTWGDQDELAALWPTAQSAAGYLLDADRDGDGLLDAVSRRDRWSSDRSVLTTIDLAALGAAGLRAAERLARLRGDTALAERAAAAANRVRPVLNGPFWNANDRRFNFAKRTGGSYVPLGTVLPAVPMIFDLLDAGPASTVVEAFARAGYSRDWGVGMIGASDEPAAAAGAEGAPIAPSMSVADVPAAVNVVSPVYTGWAALAAYRNNRPEAAFAHTLTDLLLLPHGNAGYATPVFDGAGFTARGSLEQSAAAQAMTLLPVVWGTLGIRPDALTRSIDIRPQLPATWNRVNVNQVRVGDAEFGLQVRRSAAQTTFQIDNWRGDRDIVLRFTLYVPQEVAIGLDPNSSGFEILGETVEEGARRAATVAARLTPDAGRATLSLNHDPFPRVMAPSPLAARPQQASFGLRIVRTRYRAGVLNIQAEGLPGQEYTLTVASPWSIRQVANVPNARIVNKPEEGIATITLTVPGSGSRYRPLEFQVTFDR